MCAAKADGLVPVEAAVTSVFYSSTSPVMIFLGSVMPYRPMAANVNMMPSSVPNWPT